jgi:sporulation protein YlmC with PRC-barrel domain
MVITGDDLLDFNVADVNGNLLGEVKDLVIEPNQMQANAAGGTGRITYVIVQTELNDDWLVPVPWQFVQIRPEWRALTLPVSVNQLMAAPSFHEDVWPASLANEWQATTTQFWQSPPQNPAPAVLQPPAASVVPINYIRASDLFDLDVIDARGVDLGEVKDIALDLSSSQPANGAIAAQFSYLIIDRGDALGLGGELIPIPWRLVPVTPNQQKVAILNLQPQVLQGAPSFMDNARPDLYADPWRSDLARYWDNIR